MNGYNRASEHLRLWILYQDNAQPHTAALGPRPHVVRFPVVSVVEI